MLNILQIALNNSVQLLKLKHIVSTSLFFIYANNEPKSVLARDLGDCRDNEQNSQRVFCLVCASNGPKLALLRYVSADYEMNCNIFVIIKQLEVIGDSGDFWIHNLPLLFRKGVYIISLLENKNKEDNQMTEEEYKIKYKDKYKTLLAFVNDSEVREELVKFRKSWERSEERR